MGSHWAFIGAVTLVVAWALTGPTQNYGDTWQLQINTPTTVLTFLGLFLIQNTQNRNDAAMHLKLDEILLALERADDNKVGIESSTQEEIEELKCNHAN